MLQAVRDRALLYQEAGIPIGGIGVEAQATNFDLTLMKVKYNLDNDCAVMFWFCIHVCYILKTYIIILLNVRLIKKGKHNLNAILKKAF